MTEDTLTDQRDTMMKALRPIRSVRLWTALLASGLAACGDDPVAIEFEVIEETEFAASLNIDLSQMTQLANGVYIMDIVAGTGDTLQLGDDASVDHTGWLSDGTVFSSGEFVFETGPNAQFGVIPGFEAGVLGMQIGGTRLMIIPPEQAYGSNPPINAPKLAGRILIFEVELLDLP